MSEVDTEVAFKEDDSENEETAPPNPITTCDMDVILRGWEEKFAQITECLREVQMASERANSDMCLVSQEARAQGEQQEWQIQTMQEGLQDFLRKFETARPPSTHHVNTPTASTPYGVPTRIRQNFEFQPSPVIQEDARQAIHSTLPHIRSARTVDHEDIHETRIDPARSTLPHIASVRTGDHEDIRETRIDHARSTLPHIVSARTGEHNAFRDARTRDQDDFREHDAFRDTRTQEHSDDRDARNRVLQFRLNERPTHEDDRENNRNMQQNSYHPGNNTSIARPSSSPKVPSFDGTNSAQFRPWMMQFEAIARHQGWTVGERVVCLVSSLTGPAANLIGARVRFETHVELGSHARKSNEGLYTVQGGNRNELTLEEVTRAARRLGFGLRPWIVRQQNSRGFSNNSPGRNQNSGEQQQSPKFTQSGNGNARTPNPLRTQTPVGEVKCWTCGKIGHYASDCKSSGPKFAFAPKALKMNFLQQIADQVQEFSEEEQNPRSGME